MSKSKVEVAQEWYQRVWSDEDPCAIDEMMVHNTKAHGLGAQSQVGPEEFKQFQKALLGILGNVKITIDHHIEDGDWLSQLVTITGVCRNTDKDVSMTGQIMVKIVGEKLLEGYNHVDFMTLYEQLGLLPDQTFETCLSGQKVA